MFERIAASFELAKSSWRVLRTDKQLLIFPFLSGIGCLLVMLGFAAPFLAKPQWLDALLDNGGNGAGIELYLILFAYYFCNYFVVVFCNAALISCALIRFNGGEPTVGDGLRAATSRLPQIAAWAAVAATVGVVLKAIENAHEKAGALISWLLGTAWTVITFFVVPVLVVEKVGPFDAVQRSIAILKKTWGEALVGNWGIGLFVLLLGLPILLLGVVGAWLLSQSVALGVAVLVVAGAYFLVWLAVGSALNGIFLGALYQYAAYDRVPGGFEGAHLAHVFRRKTA